MPLINTPLRTPGGPRSHRPHLILVAGLVVFLVVVTVIGGWSR